jgi:hypothetical protein
MKKLICIALSVVMLVLAGSTEGFAFRGGHGGHVRVGVFVGPAWYPGWGYPYYPYYPYYAAPPVVIQQQPETYIQQSAPSGEEHYWYYCKDPKGYYPQVKKCPNGWQKVVPAPTPDEGEE